MGQILKNASKINGFEDFGNKFVIVFTTGGDMSLVGTRPPTVGEVEQYDLHHKVRLSMKPGMDQFYKLMQLSVR